MRSWLLPAALCAAAAALAFSLSYPVALLGWDSYPLILTSRLASWQDVAETFTRPLMDDRYSGGFYRPLLSLSFALDHALFGLAARGYQLTSALWFGACAGLLAIVIRRSVASHASLAAVAGALFFTLHPLQAEVFPVPPRRAELMCCAFLLLALALQRRSSGVSLAGAVATLAAVGSKETGVLGPVLVFTWVVCNSPRPGRQRWVHALVAGLPHAIAVLLALGVRGMVLGGLGGHARSGLELHPDRLLRATTLMGEWLIAPHRLAGFATVVTAVAAGAGLLCWWRLVRREPREQISHGLAPVALVWLAFLALSYSAAGRLEPWYMLLPAAGGALLLGSLVSLGGRASAVADSLTRWPARVTLGACALRPRHRPPGCSGATNSGRLSASHRRQPGVPPTGRETGAIHRQRPPPAGESAALGSRGSLRSRPPRSRDLRDLLPAGVAGADLPRPAVAGRGSRRTRAACGSP